MLLSLEAGVDRYSCPPETIIRSAADPPTYYRMSRPVPAIEEEEPHGLHNRVSSCHGVSSSLFNAGLQKKRRRREGEREREQEASRQQIEEQEEQKGRDQYAVSVRRTIS